MVGDRDRDPERSAMAPVVRRLEKVAHMARAAGATRTTRGSVSRGVGVGRTRQLAPPATGRHGANGTAKAAEASAVAEHELLGLSDAQLLEMFEMMLRARATDERQWIWQRQGKQAFHISCQGHEGS